MQCRDGEYPIRKITWFDCQKFVRKLNSMTRWEYRFALSTEAQWEFAARGGMKSKGFKCSGSDNIDDVAWYEDNNENSFHPVASKKPNELGIYDMNGNVSEWCEDEWDAYPDGPVTEPETEPSGTYKIFRGGSALSGVAMKKLKR